MNSAQLNELRGLLTYLTPQELAEVDRLLLDGLPRWMPLPGPQTDALNSPADILFYGGAAGGGKTDLLIGAALTQHDRSIIFRREGTQLQAIYDRTAEILGNRDGFNGQDKIWRLDGRQMEFGATPNLGDERKYQGRPHDYIGFDEITHFPEVIFRWLIGWLRTTKDGQRCRVICAGNPPTDSDGEWVKRYWGAWLDPAHANPAMPGELRWYVVGSDGNDMEVDGPEPVEVDGELHTPKSRTFIPSKIQDNPYLLETGYMATLQSLPEPLRSQMLRGDFSAGGEDNPWQVIPTAWVDEAQKRWTPDGRKGKMDSVGVDIARGGKDKTEIFKRYGAWFDIPKSFPGKDTPDGPITAAMILAETKDAAPIHVDVIGVGASVYDHLKGNNVHVIPVNSAESSDAMDKTHQLRFVNKRAELWWKMREALDPANRQDIALPPSPELKADLCVPRWKLMARGIQIESKDDIKKRIGRSPDKGDACVLALMATVKRGVVKPSNAPSGGWMGM